MLTDQDLDRFYGMREQARRFMTALENTVHHRLVGGSKIPSAKLVEKKTNRVWKPGAAAALKAAFGDKAFTTAEIKSPAQIEKLSSRGKELALEYGYKPESHGLSVAPLSDPRPQAKPKTMPRFSKATRSRLTKRDFRNGGCATCGFPWGLNPVYHASFCDRTLHFVEHSAGAEPPPGRVLPTKGQKEVTMAETIRYTLIKPARLLYSSITQKSAPRGTQGATPKFSATFGLEDEDFQGIVKIMVDAIKSELGSFSGNPGDYYLAAMSG
jgi:hypothetical protein